MTSNDSDLAYPAEYYYPEFLENRPEDPRKSPSNDLPFATAIENAIGSSSHMPIKTTKPTSSGTTPRKKAIDKNRSAPTLAADIATDQGLPATDITEATKTDPKKSLVRDPAERNIPKLIVDDKILKQSVRTPRVVTTNLDDSFGQTAYPGQTTYPGQTAYPGQTGYGYPNNYDPKSAANGYANGGITDRSKTASTLASKQQKVKYADEEEEPIDDYWKNELRIDDDGAVTVEPLKYDRNTYDGPYGLSRQGSFIYFVGLGIITILAGVFLIVTGVFYSQNYPSSSSSTGTLTGMGVCGLAFYLGLLLILIGVWHQKYRHENPKKIVTRPSKLEDSTTDLKTSMEENQNYDYSYQQPMDYGAYGGYANPSYVTNVNEQAAPQQTPGVTTGAGMYDPGAWPSNAPIELQPNPKFLQPMEMSFGAAPPAESPSTVIGFTPAVPAPDATATAAAATTATAVTTKPTEKSQKKRHRHHHHRRHHHHSKKSDEDETSKPTISSAPKPPPSTTVEAPLPVLSKAPETNDLIKSIVEAEKTATGKETDRAKGKDNELEDVSSDDDHHHRGHRSHRHRRHGRRHHRHHSRSPCSTCSDRSRDAFHSDVGHDHHHHHHVQPRFRTFHSQTREKLITPRPVKDRVSTPPRRNNNVYREISTGTGLDTKIMKDSSVTADLEDVPNVRDPRLEQIPVVRRTIIVEPYPAEPTAQIVVKPQSNMVGKVRLNKEQGGLGGDEFFVPPTSSFFTRKPKKKKQANDVDELRLEDVNDDYHDNNDQKNPTRKVVGRTFGKATVKNAFYN